MRQADRHIGRNVSRRVEVVEIDDSGPIQTITVVGLADEYFKLPLRGQRFGMTGVPPKGSVGYLHMPNGCPDQAMLSDLEHPDLRPRNRVEGETVLYGKKGQKIELDDDGNIILRTPQGEVLTNP